MRCIAEQRHSGHAIPSVLDPERMNRARHRVRLPVGDQHLSDRMAVPSRACAGFEGDQASGNMRLCLVVYCDFQLVCGGEPDSVLRSMKKNWHLPPRP